MINIRQTMLGSIATIELEGRLDALTAVEADDVFGQALSSSATSIIANLGGVDYMSSAGLRILVKTAKALSVQQGRLVLCALQAPVRDVLEISGLLPLFPVAATEAEALALAQGNGQ